MPLRSAISVGPVVRDPDEQHRASTPLELFFDLCIVVAVAEAAAGLHHEVVAGHVADGVIGFAMGFFGVWWAWMNFTWFASAHDADDLPYRLLTLVQMAGALVYAAGVSRAVEDHTFTVCVVGYLIMRAGLITQWVRVGRRFPEQRVRCYRYAGGIAVVQVLWLGILATPPEWTAPLFLLLAVGEMYVPWWAEGGAGRLAVRFRLFHPDHIEERYGLFTIIVLGESLLSATVGIKEVAEGGVSAGLVAVASGGLVLAFGAWWLYFDHPGHLRPTERLAFRWGYAHSIVFASLAALGAGLHVAAEAAHDEVSSRTGALSIAIPVALYLCGLALLMLLTHHAATVFNVGSKLIGAVAMVLIGLTAPVGVAVAGCAVVMAALVGLMLAIDPPSGRPADPAVV
ncbi:MAG: low temperature requirement protein A [Ilumatobacteraceae bacterium]